MILYKAKKGNIEFFIQPNAIMEYSNLGYEILKVEEKPVTDIYEESAVAIQNSVGTSKKLI